MSLFLIITSIRKLLVVLLTVFPYPTLLTTPQHRSPTHTQCDIHKHVYKFSTQNISYYHNYSKTVTQSQHTPLNHHFTFYTAHMPWRCMTQIVSFVINH